MVRLPSEYQEIKYLESRGAQYIDTGVKFSGNETKIETNFLLTWIQPNVWSTICATQKDASTRWGALQIYGPNRAIRCTAGDLIGDSGVYLGTAQTNKRYQVKIITNSNAKTNYAEISTGVSGTVTFGGSIDTDTTLCLFCKNTMNTKIEYSNARIYSFKLSKDNELVLNLIPCYRKSDHKPGMYDLVSKTFFTNAGTGEFIVGPDVIRHDTHALVLRRRLLLNTPHIETASGSIATFNTDMVGKLKECKIYFEPVQEGEGDPSPDNVRPITGWTGCEGTRCGKNLLNYRTFVSESAGWVVSSQRVFPKEQYTISSAVGFAKGFGILVKDQSGQSVINAYPYASPFVYKFNKSVSLTYISFTNGEHSSRDILNAQLQLELGDTATEYEPYNGTTIPIDWTDEAGTVYGGYVDLVKGEVVAETASKHMSELTWTKNPNANIFNGAGFTNRKKRYDGNNSNGCFCDSYAWFTSSTIINSSGGIALANSISDITRSTLIYVKDTRYNDVESFVSSFTNYDPIVVLPLATPIHYPIDPITIKTLRGTNNIFANTNGDTEVKFYTH